MRTYTFTLSLVLAALVVISSVQATTFPPSSFRPAVSLSEAVDTATEFAASHREDIKQFYIDRVWIFSLQPNQPSWIISWACPTKGYYFVAVDMNRIASIPPESGVTKFPRLGFHRRLFMEWHFLKPIEKRRPLPVPPAAPPVKFIQAVRLARKFAAKHHSHFGQFYMDRIWLGHWQNEKKRSWIVSWIWPGKTYWFDAVQMDGKARLPHSGGFDKDPFMEWHFLQLGEEETNLTPIR